MAIYKALDEVQVLSPPRTAWLAEQVGGKWRNLLKQTAISAVMIQTRNPHRPNETLYDEALRADKLHDGHPQLIVETVEAKFGKIFDNLPISEGSALDLTKKKAFISEFITCVLKLGMRRYGKPNLRKDSGQEEDVLDIDDLENSEVPEVENG